MPTFTAAWNNPGANNNEINIISSAPTGSTGDTSGSGSLIETIEFLSGSNDFQLPPVGTDPSDIDPNTQVEVNGTIYDFYVEGYGAWPVAPGPAAPNELDNANDPTKDPLTGVKIVLVKPGDPLDGQKLFFTLEEFEDPTAVDWADAYINGISNGSINLDAPDPMDPPPALCFGAGTKILTSSGEQRVEDLEVGDLVMTRDAGLLPIRWIGSREMPASDNFAPIIFSTGSIGNEEDLTLSPQHRLSIKNWRATLLLGTDETLIKAKDMVNGDTIYRKEGGTVQYFHIVLDSHHLVYANGVLAETMLIGAEALKSLDEESIEELQAIFPEKFVDDGSLDVACAHVSSSKEASAILH